MHFIPNESSGSLREIFEAKLKLALLAGDTARAGMILFLGKLFISLSSLGGERTVATDDSDEIERKEEGRGRRERGRDSIMEKKEGMVTEFFLLLDLDDWTRKGMY